MRTFWWLAAAIAVAGSLATGGCGGSGTVVPAAGDGVPASGYSGAVRHRGPHYAYALGVKSKGVVPLFPYVPYSPDHGPVLVAPKFYLVFWDYKKYGDPDRLEPLLTEYTKVMGGSSHNNIETQYYEESGKKKTYMTNPDDQFGGSWDDEAPIPKTPTDADVAAQALKAVAHFGYDPNGVYVIATPHKHSEADFGTIWCSYHSETSEDKKLVPYANLPYMTDASQNGAKCGANYIKPPSDENGKDEGMTIFAGHEYGESSSDPDAYTAWWGPQGEIADPCVWVDIANDPFGDKSYTMQSMVSDASETCVQSYTASSTGGPTASASALRLPAK
jgi:hypothetical protein